MKQIFECPVLRRSTRNLQMFIAIFIGLAGGYLLVNLILIGFKDKPFFIEWMPVAVFVFFAGLIVQIVIWFISKGKLTVFEMPDGEHEVSLVFPNGTVEVQKGKFEVLTTYTKTYARYGMYYKNLALVLFCNDQPFCLLRHQLGGAHSAPKGFIEVGQLINPAETEYWCKKVPAIFQMLRK